MSVHPVPVLIRRKCASGVLLTAWAIGSVLGTALAQCWAADLVPLIFNAVRQRVSVSGMLTADVLPFLLGALAVRSSERWLLPLLGCWKGFAFCFNVCGVAMAFGDAGWLIRCLLLFSDCLLVPALCVFFLRHISDSRILTRWESCAWPMAALAVGIVDYFCVSPFLMGLF